jgi:succinyl-CoA synthetase beta subunit
VDLFEYQGKQYFARYDIPVSPGGPADTVDEAVAAADAAGYPVVVKAQVQVGGRGTAGGIKLADNAAEVREHAGNILGMDIKGHVVKRLWVESASDIDEEYYASYTLDRAAKKHLLMLSREGGVEIEVVAEENPDAIVKVHIDPVDGFDHAAAMQACVAAYSSHSGWRYSAFSSSDTFASSACTLPSGVRISGLISTRSASPSTYAL